MTPLNQARILALVWFASFIGYMLYWVRLAYPVLKAHESAGFTEVAICFMGIFVIWMLIAYKLAESVPVFNPEW